VSARCPSRVRAPSPTFKSPKWAPFLNLFGALSCVITCVLSCGSDRWDLKIVGTLLPYSEMKTTACLPPSLAHPSSPLGLTTTPFVPSLCALSHSSPRCPHDHHGETNFTAEELLARAECNGCENFWYRHFSHARELLGSAFS
jgi:hypothetical protein